MLDHNTRCTQVFNELQRLFNKRMQMSLNHVQLRHKLNNPDNYLVKQGPENPEDPATKQEPTEDTAQKRLDEQALQSYKNMHDEVEASIKALLYAVMI